MVGFRFDYFFGAMLAQLSLYNRSAAERLSMLILFDSVFSKSLHFFICFFLSLNLEKF